jgi:DNA-binding MarR family transcriptional regulator
MASTELSEETRTTRTRSTGILLAQHGRAATRRFTAALEPIGMKPRHVAALMQLHDNGPMSQQALGDALHVDPSNLVALLNDLEDEGLALRRRDPEDRRRHIVEISDAGRARLAEAEDALAQAETDLLAGLEDEERSRLHEMLSRIQSPALDVEAFEEEASTADEC